MKSPETAPLSHGDNGDFDVAVIGAGPKGLAMQHALQQHDVSSVLFEARNRAGAFFAPNRINRRTTITPHNLEILPDPALSFQTYLRSRSPSYQRRYPLVRGFPSSDNFRHYLQWLSQHISGLRFSSPIHHLALTPDGHIQLNRQHTVASVVLATGMGAPRDPTGLVRTSDRVIHADEQNTHADWAEFAAEKD